MDTLAQEYYQQIIMETQAILDIVEQDFNVFETNITDNPKLLTAIDKNDRYILHWAAVQGRDRVVELLLKYDNPPINELDGATKASPLILATLKGSLKIVKMLVENGADINQRNAQGHSSIQYACSKGWEDVAEYLLKKGVDINVVDSYGDSSLHRIASLGRIEILEMLLKYKPNVNCQNSQGNTPLHIACEDDEATIALALVQHGADAEIKNKDNKTAVDLCKPGLRRSILEKISK